MRAYVCDQCGNKCDKHRITIKEIGIWINHKGKNVSGEIDLCCTACFKIWFNEMLHEEGFLVGGMLTLVYDD